MRNTNAPGGNTGETNQLITATLSGTRQFLWEAEHRDVMQQATCSQFGGV